MNEKQMKFCEEYIRTRDTRASAIYAGYSSKTAKTQGAKILAMEEVALYLEEQFKITTEERVAGVEEVMKFWTEAMKERGVDSEGNTFISNMQMKASENIMKYYRDMQKFKEIEMRRVEIEEQKVLLMEKRIKEQDNDNVIEINFDGSFD